MRVAGISASPALLDTLNDRMSQLDPQKFNAEMASGTNTPDDRAVFRQAWAPIVDEMLARSEQEARAGAKIIVWPECAVEGFKTTKPHCWAVSARWRNPPGRTWTWACAKCCSRRPEANSRVTKAS